MPLTRATAEGSILHDCQGMLWEALGTAIIPPIGTAVASPNPWLGWSVSAALLDCHVAVADISNPTDAECSAIDGPVLMPKWRDCAEYRALSAALNQYLQVNKSLGQVAISKSDIGSRLQEAVKLKAEQIKERYGVGVFNPGYGTIAVGQIPPYLARPQIPQSQNWPPRTWGAGSGGYGYGGWGSWGGW